MNADKIKNQKSIFRIDMIYMIILKF